MTLNKVHPDCVAPPTEADAYIQFEIKGMFFYKDTFSTLALGDSVVLSHDVSNYHDENSIIAATADRKAIGFIARERNSKLLRAYGQGFHIPAFIAEIPPKPRPYASITLTVVGAKHVPAFPAPLKDYFQEARMLRTEPAFEELEYAQRIDFVEAYAKANDKERETLKSLLPTWNGTVEELLTVTTSILKD